MSYENPTVYERLRNLNYGVLIPVTILSMIGFMVLYSAGGGSFNPWAQPQILRFIIGFALMVGIAISPVSLVLRSAYVVYGVSMVLLVLVAVMGKVGMGAQRWLDLYVIKLQPSELGKISLIMALACYFHRATPDDLRSFKFLLIPFLLILLPVALVMKQPDLGTAMLLLAIGISVLFAIGIKMRYFAIGGGLLLSSIPVLWQFLYDYQKDRILTFITPERDPLGTGYHVLQSKIAIGSGGFWGKGFLQGTQGHLNFLPEKQTDFIFTMFAEEFGFVGAFLLISVYVCLLFQTMKIVLNCRSHFTQLLAFGIMMMLFINVFINIAMVMGLVPVVGVPLPLVSYGGTSMLTFMISIGLLLNADIYGHLKMARF
jgi:rod shape determining protein RodA